MPRKYNISYSMFQKSGTALLMTILILNSIVLISLAAAKLVISGVKMGGTQAKSTKAYFAAEAGAEEVLWQYRKAGSDCDVMKHGENFCNFSKVLPNGTSYQVNYVPESKTKFVSIGAFSGLKRSVELSFKY